MGDQSASAIGTDDTSSSGSPDVPLVLLVHGNGETAECWSPLVRALVSRGLNRDDIVALDLPKPFARSNGSDDDDSDVSARSSTGEHRQCVVDALRSMRHRSSRPIIVVAHSRGGNAVRDALLTTAVRPELVVLAGSPIAGLACFPKVNLRNEFNGGGEYLRGLNAKNLQLLEQTRVVTLRSDFADKFYQPDGRFIGLGVLATNVGSDGPSIDGAENLMAPGADHRELISRVDCLGILTELILGRDLPQPRAAEEKVEVSGIVFGHRDGVPVNDPATDVALRIWRIDPELGAPHGEPLVDTTLQTDGRFGPVEIAPHTRLAFDLRARGTVPTRIHRGGFAATTDLVRLRAELSPPSTPDGAAQLLVRRLHRFFDLDRDNPRIDGKVPRPMPDGVNIVPAEHVSGLPWLSAVAAASAPADSHTWQLSYASQVCRVAPAADGWLNVVELSD